MSAEAASAPISGSTASGSTTGLERIALGVGLTGIFFALVGVIVALLDGASRPAFGLLVGLGYWLSISIGILMLIMIWYLFDAGWPIAIRRQMEHWLDTFKYLAVLFIPLPLASIVGGGAVWEWMGKENVVSYHDGQPMTVGEDVLYLHKEAFLNIPAFLIGAVIFFACWILLSNFFRRHSFALDSDGNHMHVRYCRWMSAAGIPLLALTLTFAAIYWFKSLEYHWFSTMYGVWFFATSMWAASAFIVVMMYLQERNGNLKGILKPAHYYLMGCILLAFTVFWAYISFSQYFLIYNANIPEETFWYNIRLYAFNADGTAQPSQWWWVAMVLIFGHFFIPFFILLLYPAKFGFRLFLTSIYILIVHVVDIYWNIIPVKHPDQSVPGGYAVNPIFAVENLYDIAGIIGVGGICVWAYLRSAKTTKAIPIRDPRILESVNCHE